MSRASGSPRRRELLGSAGVPRAWTVVTRDLWQEFGAFTLTGMAPTAMQGPALFDRIENRVIFERDVRGPGDRDRIDSYMSPARPIIMRCEIVESDFCRMISTSSGSGIHVTTRSQPG